MNIEIKNKLAEYTKEYGHSTICAVLAYALDIGDEVWDRSPEELIKQADQDKFQQAIEDGVSDWIDDMMLDEDLAVQADVEFRAYVADENGDYKAIENAVQNGNNAAKAAQPVAPIPAPVPVQTAPSTPALQPAVTTVAPAPSAPPAPVSAAPAAKTANYANFISDSFESGFGDWNDFRRCITDMEATETVYTHDEDLQACGIGYDPTQPNLRIESVMNSPISAGQMAQKMQSDPDAVLSTMVSEGGTGLALDMRNGRVVPIGASAIEGMCARAGFTSDGYSRNWNKSPEEAAIGFNRQFGNGKGGVTVIERCSKVRAICSKQFAYGKFSDILDMFEAFWKSTFPNGTVQNMYISHNVMRWELNLDTYKGNIFNGFPELLNGPFYPVLQFATSNTANSAFRIMPALQQTGGNSVVPICSHEESIRVRHTASGNFGERVSQLQTSILEAYASSKAMMDSRFRNLDALKGIQVNNAYNAILRTMDDCEFPKKQGMEAATNFKNFNGLNPATAFECLVVLMNAYSFVVRDNPQKTALQFKTALAVGRAVNAPWEARGNIPGDYSWK